MMTKKVISSLTVLSVLLLASCAREILSQEESSRYVLISLDPQLDSETKLALSGGLSLQWESGDKIGIFSGENKNVPLVYDTLSSCFSGMILPVSGEPLYAYYPYDFECSFETNVPVNMSNQVYDGDFLSDGTFPGLEKYGKWSATIDNYSSTGGGTLHFTTKFSILRFHIHSNLDRTVNVREISLESDSSECFSNVRRLDLPASLQYYMSSNCLTLGLAQDKALAPGDDIYAIMATSFSSFSDDTTSLDLSVLVEEDGIEMKYHLPKKVTSRNNFPRAGRRTISADLSDDLRVERSRCVTYTGYGRYAFTPSIGSNSEDFQPGRTLWGDGSEECYYDGMVHSFDNVNTLRTSSFSFWGTSQSVSFENLENIVSIDLRNF